MAKFEPGDVVVLKSHPAHRMTIEKINDDGTYKCVWQKPRTFKKESDDYPEVVLEKWESQAGMIYLR